MDKCKICGCDYGHTGDCPFEDKHTVAEKRLRAECAALRRQLAAAKETETTLRSALHHQQDKRIEAGHALAAANERAGRLEEALVRLRDCDWTITPADRMDAVRDIARKALEVPDAV